MAATEGFFKVIIIGDYSVGKSSIMNKLCFDKFSDKYNVTVGVEFESKEIDVDGESVQFQIWDTVENTLITRLVKINLKAWLECSSQALSESLSHMLLTLDLHSKMLLCG